MQTLDVQQLIKNELSRLGWSQNYFVSEYNKRLSYKSHLTDESFKKQLSRPSTKIKLLEVYLKFIQTHDSYKKLEQIRPTCTSNNELTSEFSGKMKNISKSITKKLLFK